MLARQVSWPCPPDLSSSDNETTEEDLLAVNHLHPGTAMSTAAALKGWGLLGGPGTQEFRGCHLVQVLIGSCIF